MLFHSSHLRCDVNRRPSAVGVLGAMSILRHCSLWTWPKMLGAACTLGFGRRFAFFLCFGIGFGLRFAMHILSMLAIIILLRLQRFALGFDLGFDLGFTTVFS